MYIITYFLLVRDVLSCLMLDLLAGLDTPDSRTAALAAGCMGLPDVEFDWKTCWTKAVDVGSWLSISDVNE